MSWSACLTWWRDAKTARFCSCAESSMRRAEQGHFLADSFDAAYALPSLSVRRGICTSMRWVVTRSAANINRSREARSCKAAMRRAGQVCFQRGASKANRHTWHLSGFGESPSQPPTVARFEDSPASLHPWQPLVTRRCSRLLQAVNHCFEGACPRSPRQCLHVSYLLKSASIVYLPIYFPDRASLEGLQVSSTSWPLSPAGRIGLKMPFTSTWCDSKLFPSGGARRLVGWDAGHDIFRQIQIDTTPPQQHDSF